MSDVSQGPGWWEAVDGRWYPPEQHPSYGRVVDAHDERPRNSQAMAPTETIPAGRPRPDWYDNPLGEGCAIGTA